MSGIWAHVLAWWHRRFAGGTPAAQPAARLIDRLAQPLDDLLLALFEVSAEGVLVVDRHGLIVRTNDRLRDMLDAHVDIAPGRPAIAIFAAADREDAREELAPALAGRRPPRIFSTRLDSLCAGDQSVEVSGVAVREADGTVSGLILRLYDVTLQKQLEAQLAQSQKLQAMGQLAGGIAHDFNNLLTATIGAADLIATRPGVDAETLDDVAQIRSSADRGAGLVSQLLAFGRQQTLQPKAVSINGAIHDLSLLLRRLIDGRVRLDLDLETPERMVRVDPTQLDQVLLNLAVNARDAMPNGGVLTLRSGHMTLFQALVRGEETIAPGRYVMIEVQDTGVGIPPEVLPRIFDPFFTTRRERGGSGLGLSTVHGIIRQSDGFLAVESEPGQGTRLRVYLPRYEPAAEVAIPKRASREDGPDVIPAGDVSVGAVPSRIGAVGTGPFGAAASGGGEDRTGAAIRTVLLVDDEDAVRRLARRALAQAGWQVVEADSAEAALALLEGDTAPDALALLITDVVMPGIDGPALVRKIHERFPALPAILVSGYAREALPRDSSAENITFLPKPYTLRSLVAHAETAVAKDAVPV